MANGITPASPPVLTLLWQRMFDRPPRALHLEEVTVALVAEVVAEERAGGERPQVDVRA